MSKQIREIRVKDLVRYFYLPLVIFFLLTAGFLILLILTLPLWIKFAATAVYLLLLYFTLKHLAIGCILMYKAYAPMDVRRRCRFEPTCSTYMLMAIQKYGLIRGVIKGVKRIHRCKPPNGGVDYP